MIKTMKHMAKYFPSQVIQKIQEEVPLTVKIMGIVGVFICLLGLTVIIDMRSNMTKILDDQLRKRAITIGNEVATESMNLILVGDLIGLYEKAKTVVLLNEDVRYVLIIDEKGYLVAHNFGHGIPVGLLELRQLEKELTEVDVIEVDSEEGNILDVLVPLGGDTGWVRIGMSEVSMNRTINTLSIKLMLTTLGIIILGLFGGFIMSHLLTRPIKRLVDASIAVAEGDLSQRVSIGGHDEIGQLGRSFNGMAENLERYTQEREALLAELMDKEQVRQQLLNKVISAQEEERKRIARELHDEAGQSLTSLIIGLKLLGQQNDIVQARSMAEDLRKVAYLTLEDVHRLAVELRPTVLDDMGLVVALERYVTEYKRQQDIMVIDLEVHNQVKERLPSEMETTLYRIVQEALTNVAKYAKARNVSIVLELRPEGVNLIIEDDGIGFDVEQVLSERTQGRQNLGLAGMQERSALFGGTFEIESEPGRGTTLYVRLPLKGRP
ncbi:MAG: sensor histidine kinase [Desulfitobacterium hafniense]|nr:sensor histidine kinase [Desulfitobacterium hafniense]